MVQNHAKQDITVNVGDRFPLTIRRLGVNGHGIGYFKHKVCFVPGALPDEVVVAEVTAIHPRYLEAKIISCANPAAFELNRATAMPIKQAVLNLNAWPTQSS